MQKKVIHELNFSTVDHQTGEVKTDAKVTTFQIPTEPPFVKLYIQDLSNLYELPRNSPELLFELLKKLDYEGMISLNSSNRKIICERTGKSEKTLANFLTTLVEHDIFRRISTGVYMPNPALFGRGEWREIHKRREMWLKVNYDEDGNKKITSSLGQDA